ncbi:MAG: alkaline phosphatase [Bacillota bacterium]
MNSITKRMSVVLIIVVLLSVFNVPGIFAGEKTSAKNVILLIPDGMSLDGTSLARWYKVAPLAMDEMACGLVRTYSSDAAIADSAPAGTAFATGYKSHTGYIGVLPDVANMPGLKPIAEGDEKRPVANVLEAARLAGKSTGIISTSEIQHATPAAFSAHYPDRKNYDWLGEQQVYSGVDVVLGGGHKFLATEGRKDGEDLLKEIIRLGYDYVTTPGEMKKSKSGKLWGMFAPADLSYEMDRDSSKQPSLSEMTAKAIEVLSRDKDGFFLMVEGSKIDWAAHANDPMGIISDILAFDDAVKVALDFAKKDKNTVVIAVSDHGNGGISIGDRGTTKSYDKEPLETFIGPLKKARVTGEGLELLLDKDRTNIKYVMSTYFGINDLTDEETAAIKSAKAGSMNYTVGPIISKRAYIGWTTGGHTGEEVVLYVYSPGSGRPTGVIENTDVANYMEKVLGLDLKKTTEQLFVPAEKAFSGKGASVEIDNSDSNNPVLVVKKGADTIKLPVNKNYALVNEKAVKMNGFTVYNGVSFYVPDEAVKLVK